MTNRTGPEFENRTMKYLREHGFDVERLRLTGKEDEGDLRILDGGVLIAELKAEKRINLGGYMREAQVEAANYAKHRGLDPSTITPIAIVKRRNHPVGKSYVVMELDTFFDIQAKA